MQIPIFLLMFIVFLAFLSFKRNQQTKSQKAVNETFLERERAANSTRRKDISNLDYLDFSLSALPVGKYPDAALLVCEDTLKSLTSKRILNLSNKTNTDLKLLYGPANLDVLTEYDENFMNLTKTLISYAARQKELEHIQDAINILEYGMSIHSEISQNYLHLAALYQQNGCLEKLSSIYNALEGMNESFAEPIRQKLDADFRDSSVQTG